ncbi:MAG TPA: hydrogenase expression/formation protein HypE [Polyangiaceae bacterium]|jgi:hydrogenase expression/formation protein HypE
MKEPAIDSARGPLRDGPERASADPLRARPPRRLTATTITLAHGSGGKAMRDLIADVFVQAFDDPELSRMEDQARIDLTALGAHGSRLAFTTDSYVVDPLFFPGGDIGSLAVCGTVNDLAVGGAVPLYLTCAMIIEEGFSVELLRRIVQSMKATAREAGVRIVTGDTKVVPRGSADKVFINTAGVGVIPEGIEVGAGRALPGDKIVINGHIGDHGAAIALARGQFALESTIRTDCQPLYGLVRAMLDVCPEIRALRDATRGGVAAVLSEFAEASDVGLLIDEAAIPVRPEVRALCELLGLDPIYLANEGKVVAIVPDKNAGALLARMRSHPAGADSAIVGEVVVEPKRRVVAKTVFGGERVVDLLFGEQLPRIC